jgi:hypothetical protein
MVRIPCSAARQSQRIFAMLVERVEETDPRSWHSGFEGNLLRPGSYIDLDALWPSASYPEVPMVLECAGNPKPERGHRRHHQPDTYILWSFNVDKREWSEIARISSFPRDWPRDLRPIAVRALEQSNGKQVQVFAGFDQVMESLCRLMDCEIKTLPPADRPRALAMLRDQCCCRLVCYIPIDARFPGEGLLSG